MTAFGDTFGKTWGQQGSKLNLCPYYSDALFFLDGTINVTGTALVDKKNGWEFPLSAAYDWNLDIVNKIIPYKTAITLSPPANGTAAATAIQAKDVNNFWYAADGTANAIPFTSFMGDVDYVHSCFSQNVAQTTQAITGIELTPAGVKNIVLYNTVKAGADLTTCNTFFNVPVEATTNVIWVAKTGNDTTGNGSKATPYLTLMKAESVSSEKTIYVRSGTYVESHYMINPNTWVATGLVRLQTSANPYALLNSGTAVISYNGLIVDGTTKSYCLRHFATSTNKTYTKCYFVNSVTHSILNECAVNDTFLALVDCVIISTATNWIKAVGGFSLLRCYLDYNVSGGSGITLALVEITGEVNVQYSKFTGLAETLFNLSFGNKFNLTFKYNSAVVTGNFLTVTGQKTIDIGYNNILSSITPISVGPKAYTIRIYNNRCSNSGLTGYHIAVGSETSYADNDVCTDLIIENNRCVGLLATEPTESNINNIITHGIFVGYQKNAIIRYNYCEGIRIGIIKKHTTGADVSGGILYNVVKNSIEAIYVKGQDDVNIYGNTCYNSLITAATQGFKAIRISANGGTNYSTGSKLSNNILVNTLANKSSIALIHLDESGSNVVSDYNTLYAVDKIGRISTNNYADLAAWQTTGNDAHSVATNPNLSVSLVPATPVTGLALDAAFDDGLDITSSFGSATTLPVIVTRQQGATWQQGAFVQT